MTADELVSTIERVLDEHFGVILEGYKEEWREMEDREEHIFHDWVRLDNWVRGTDFTATDYLTKRTRHPSMRRTSDDR